MNEPDLTLVVFALNEIEGLKAVGPRINTQKKFLKRVLMIDGGSTDGSIEYAKELNGDVIVQPEGKKGMLNANNMAIENCNTSHMIFSLLTTIVYQKKFLKFMENSKRMIMISLKYLDI